MRKVWWLLLLLIPAVHAATISDWPNFFIEDGNFKAKYVVGEESPSMDVVSATIISTSLFRYENATTQIGTSVLDIEISDIKWHNAVVVGSPCDNKAAWQLMGEPDPCYKDLAGSAGYIQLYENNGKYQLLITGINEEDRNVAAKFIAETDLSSINSKEHIIPTTTNSTPQFFAKINQTNETVTNVTSNQTNITKVVEPEPTVEKNITTEIEVGPYEPLEKIPEKKGFFARLWSWLKSLFT